MKVKKSPSGVSFFILVVVEVLPLAREIVAALVHLVVKVMDVLELDVMINVLVHVPTHVPVPQLSTVLVRVVVKIVI